MSLVHFKPWDQTSQQNLLKRENLDLFYIKNLH